MLSHFSHTYQAPRAQGRSTLRPCALLFALLLALCANAQTGLKKVYDEEINPLEQIDQTVAKAKSEGKFVICQVGGNWCPWCLRFADFITNDTAVSKVISDNFEYIHVNYNPRRSASVTPRAEAAVTSGNDGHRQPDSAAAPRQDQSAALMARLNNCGRFGFPVFVVLDEEGRVVHIQDSSFLEEGKGYNHEKVLRFFKSWTPGAVRQ